MTTARDVPQARRAERSVSCVLGIPVDRLDMDAAVARMVEFAHGSEPRHVVTVNPEFVMAARRNPDFRHVLCAADLAVADGIGIVWAARLLGAPVPHRIGGIDLVERVAAAASRTGLRLFLLGASEGVAAEAARRLTACYPGLQIVGTFSGSPDPKQDDAIVAMVAQAGPDVLLVAFGAPAQDLWIERNQMLLGVPVAMGVGGAFDFLSGRVSRAPLPFQRLGLEWLYRLIRQPWRWRRMLALPLFALLVLAEAARTKGSPRTSGRGRGA